jgi:hypothetical protein
MRYEKIILLILLIILYIIINNKYNTIEKYSNNKSINNKTTGNIPKVIYQTYLDKTKIPFKVYNNMKKYAPNYKHIIYNDKECIKFIKENYPLNVLNAFYTLKKGAHKADLFRYCILYKYGGVYLDIKTHLIKPISNIFNKNKCLYSVIAINKKSIYQGIIASPPKNPIFKKLIDLIILNKNNTKDYLIFTKQFYSELNKSCNNNIKPGFNRCYNGPYNCYLYEEACSNNKFECYDGLDRYRLCCFVYDKNKKIIKTRYADYPWH